MNWESIHSPLEESKVQFSQTTIHTQMKEEQQNEIELLQLKKFQDPTENPERQSILKLLAHFEDLFTDNDISDTVSNVLTDDCEFFLLNSTKITPVKYCLNPKGLRSLYSGIQTQQRIVRETYIDLEKMSAVQLCNVKIHYQDETYPVDEIIAEVFTIKDNKISKYRAFIGQKTVVHGESDPFEVTRKDRILAVVKQVNFALAGQRPDFEKVATMLHESAKYKIWTWDSQKCFVLEKHNFVENFKNMQENLVIKSIVPYEMYTESQVAIGTYVYHLEGIAGKYVNKKYVWLCTCFYMLDDDYKITRVSQQGELHLEGGVEIQFAVYSRERLIQKVQNLFLDGPTLDLFYADVFALNCITYTFGPEGAPGVGYQKGTTIVDKMVEWKKRMAFGPPSQFDERKKIKPVESFVDSSDYSYDVVILIHKFDHILCTTLENTVDKGVGTVLFSMYKLEHGKIVKGYAFLSPVLRPIPSPFDDPTFDNEVFQSKNVYS